jgi:hypothetical protein
MVVGIGIAVAALVTSSTAGAVGEEIAGFPNWSERVIHEWMNRARAQPSVEMQACGANCPDGACYQPIAPLVWNEKLNHAARFHSAELTQQMYFAHDSACTVVANIATTYPGQCNGAAACACQGGVKQCMGQCTTWSQRVSLFGVNASGEIIASPQDPNQAFYLWLFESYNKATCAFDFGPPTNGHRWNILKAGPNVGLGVTTADAVGDFGGSAGAIAKIPSGSHYPRQSGSVEAWANWYDTNAGPQSALINVDGTCSAMQLKRGAATNGAYSATLANVGSGCHRYFFLFKDSQANIVTYPTTGSLGIGPANCADWDSTRPATGMGCACAPQCGGKVCGDDGCGGSCGNCGVNQTCQAGQCVGGAMDAGATDGGGTNPGDGGTNPGDGGTNPGTDGGGNPNVDGGGNPGDPNGPGAGSGCSCDASPFESSNSAWLAAAVALGLALRAKRTRRSGSRGR